jgi:hypothetical protein
LTSKQANIPVGSPKYGKNDHFKMDHKELGSEDVDRIQQIQNTIQQHVLVNMVMDLWVP